MSVIFERISVCQRVLKSEISVSFGPKYIYLLIFLVDLYSEIINNLKDNLSWFSKTLGRHFIIGKVYCLAPKTSSSANFEKKLILLGRFIFLSNVKIIIYQATISWPIKFKVREFSVTCDISRVLSPLALEPLFNYSYWSKISTRNPFSKNVSLYVHFL